MTPVCTGMNPHGSGCISDTEHLRHSVNNILTTPRGSRIMRREYGSLLPELLDAPQNDVTRLQCMSAVVMALAQWEPRIAINRVDITWLPDGRALLAISGVLTRTMQPVQMSIPLRGGNADN
ncbi:GPW/gp25 family protein [Escherichia coli O5]|nr:GPW/gp25 family protein [Escherichia coli O5]